MRDSKTSFSPIAIKQEPKDPAEQDPPTTPNTHNTHPGAAPSNNNGYGLGSHLPQALAVDLRSSQTSREPAMVGRRAGASERAQAYESTEEFVAQIARRVREESGLSSLELTPVTGLGPLGDLKTPSLVPLFTGPSSVENGGKSRGEYACGECSSRFDTARDYRAHCLTHQVLKAESMLRSSRGGSGGGGDRDVEEDTSGAVFGGMGSGAGEGVVSFKCEDCNARFSSRDTYAMHMLIRAKNEACFPTSQSLTAASSSSSSAVSAASKIAVDVGKDAGSSSAIPPLSPAPSLAGANPVPLPGSALLLNDLKRADLKMDVRTKSEAGKKGGGEGQLEDTPHSFFHTLGLDLSHVTNYSAAWWSKYMPWMAGVGMGLLGGGGSGAEGEGSALPMACYLCGELFSNRDSLAMHVLFHTRDMPASLSDSAPAAWKKPHPVSLSHTTSASPSTVLTPSSSSSSSSTSSSTSNALLLGHAAAALRQHQQRSTYNSNSITSTHDLRQSSLSPTEAAVASAAAAAVAAITPPSTQTSLMKALGRSDVSPFANRLKAGGGSDHLEGGSSRRGEFQFLQEKARAGSMEVDQLHLSPPQRGASAPIPTATPTSPLLPSSGGSGLIRSSSEIKTLPHARPLSADHVALRHRRPLYPSLADADRRHSGGHTTPALWTSAKASPKAELSGWQSGSDTPLQHSSAFNVYRLQRLKKLRMAKGPYRRPGTRGRPPMTIFGTAGRRPLGAHVPALTPSLAPSRRSSDPASPTVPLSPVPLPPSSSSSSKIGSMVQLLTSHGHVVSACAHCELLFGDKTLYQLHMGLHNVNNPWQCNACGCVCSSRLHFATHTLHY